MKNTFLIVFAIIMVAIMAACDKKETYINMDEHAEIQLDSHDYPILKNVKIIDGRLVFDSREDLNQAIEILFQNQDKLDGFEKQFTGFVSANMAFDMLNDEIENGLNTDFKSYRDYAIIIDQDGEEYFERVVFLPLESRLFNKEGVIEVGDSVYKFTYNYTIQTHSSNLNLISNFSSNKENFEYKKHHHSIDILESTLKTVSASCREDYDSRYRRLRGELKRTTSWSSVSLIVSSTSLRRPCRGSLCVWYQRQADVLRVEATGSYRKLERIIPGENWVGWTDPISFNVYRNRTNTSQVEWVIATSPYNPEDLQYVYSSVSATHKLWNDSANRECETSL